MSRLETVRAAIVAQLPKGQPFGGKGRELRRGEWVTWANAANEGSPVQVPERPGLWLNPGIVYVECATRPVALFSLIDLPGTHYRVEGERDWASAGGVRFGSWVGPSVESYLSALTSAERPEKEAAA